MDYEGMAFVKWLLTEGKTVTQIIRCESELSGVYLYDGSPYPRRAVTLRQVAAVEVRLALLQERLAAIRATRPPCPLSFYQPRYGNDADFLVAPPNEADFVPVADLDGLLEAEASGFGGEDEFDWDGAASFDGDVGEDFFGDLDDDPDR